MRQMMAAAQQQGAGGGLIELLGESVGYDSLGADIVLSLPTVTAGDVAFVYGYSTHNFGRPTFGVTGYTQSFHEKNGGNDDRSHAGFWKVLTGAESDVTCTFSFAVKWGASVHVFRGVDNTTPLDVTPTRQAFAQMERHRPVQR